MEKKENVNKKSTAVKCVVWVASIVLIVFYLAIFYLGFNRKSCLEYEMVYYRGIYFENWPGAGGINYVPGTKEKRTEEKFINRRGGGWNTASGDEMWTADESAYMMYHITDNEAGEFTIDIFVESMVSEDIAASVYVNDEKVIDKLSVGHNQGNFSYDPSVDVYTVIINSDKVYQIDAKGNVISDDNTTTSDTDSSSISDIAQQEKETVLENEPEENEPVFRGVEIYSITIDRKG